MPAQATLEKFIARVIEGAHAEAIEEFYTVDASMQENMGVPRRGRAALVAHERAALARVTSVTSTCVRPVFAQGDHVVIRWIFEFEWKNGTRGRIEELAYQRWEIDADGRERIAQEQFFYDPGQNAAL